MRKRPAKQRTAVTRVGLARTLSKLGHCSRSQAAELIRDGRVSLNGRIRRDPEMPVNLKQDWVEVDGRRIEPAKRIYLVLNKPAGKVTTAADEKQRLTVYSCLPADLPWVAPVGRLDLASEGLLLLTNDSQWGARIAAPETHLDKTYHVRVAAKAEDELLHSLTTGIETAEGDWLKAKSARVVRHGERNTWLEIVLDEGKNRHIRRMLDALGIEVLRLVRVAVGPLSLGDLAKSSYRPLTPEEKSELDRAMLHPAGGSVRARRPSRKARESK